MESHDIVKEMLKRVSAKQVAQELGVSLSLVYKWAEAPIVGSGASNPIDRVEVLTRMTGDLSPLEWLCERFNGTFVQRPSDNVQCEDFVLTIGKIIIELGHVLAECNSDGGVLPNITPDKAREIRARWEKCKAVIDCFIHAAEDGLISTTKVVEIDNVQKIPAKITPTKYKRSLATMSDMPRKQVNIAALGTQ